MRRLRRKLSEEALLQLSQRARLQQERLQPQEVAVMGKGRVNQAALVMMMGKAVEGAASMQLSGESFKILNLNKENGDLR